MKIIVVCENLMQFHNYVNAMLACNISSVATTYKECKCHCALCRIERYGTSVCVEELKFLFCKNKYALYGYTFYKNDQLVKVGSWYNIPQETLKEIEDQFTTRQDK